MLWKKKKTNKKTTARRAKHTFHLKTWLKRIVCLGLLIWGISIILAAKLPQKTATYISDQFHRISAQSGYAIEQIEVTGRTYTSPQDIRATIPEAQGASIFKTNLKKTHEGLLDLPWVKSARVQRKLPNVIAIDIVEHTPKALWQHEKTIHVLDSQGEIIMTPVLDAFSDLIILTGRDAPEHMQNLLEKLEAEPTIFEKAHAASWIGNRRWDITLKNDIILKLPEADISYALARISKAEENFLIFSKEIVSLDARFSDRLIVKASSGAAGRLSDALENTNSTDTFSVSP